jgi:uncharacterized protein (DUF697 family)
METEKTKEQEVPNPEKLGEKIIRNHLLASVGMGLIPIPLVDLAGLAGIQLNMLRKLAKTYDVPFSEEKGKSLIAALLGGGIPSLGAESVISFVKTVPLVGQTVGSLTMPVIAGASTYAVGKVFVQHFASGGTFLNFNPEQVREYYAQMFAKGKAAGEDLNKS